MIDALDGIEKALGGRSAIYSTLILAEQLDPSLKKLLYMMQSVHFARTPLYTICERAHIHPGDFLAVLKAAMISRAQLMMLHKVVVEGPEVMNALLAQAVDREELCPKCEGEGKTGSGEQESTCKACKGKGTKKIAGKIAQQKIVLELLGFLKKTGGLTIMQNNQQGVVTPVNPPSVGGSLEALQQVVTDLMYGKALPSSVKAAKQAIQAAPEAVVEGNVSPAGD